MSKRDRLDVRVGETVPPSAGCLSGSPLASAIAPHFDSRWVGTRTSIDTVRGFRQTEAGRSSQAHEPFDKRNQRSGCQNSANILGQSALLVDKARELSLCYRKLWTQTALHAFAVIVGLCGRFSSLLVVGFLGRVETAKMIFFFVQNKRKFTFTYDTGFSRTRPQFPKFILVNTPQNRPLTYTTHVHRRR